MGRFLTLRNTAFLAALLAIFSAAAEAAKEVPIFLRLDAIPRIPGSQPVKVFLSATPEGSPPTRVRLAGAPELPTLDFAIEDFPPAARSVVLSLLAPEPGADGLATTSGWEVELRGLKREAVVLAWNLVVQTGGPRPNMRVIGFQPVFYIPGEGQLDTSRPLTQTEVHRRAVVLRSPRDFRLVRRVPDPDQTGLILSPGTLPRPGAPDGLVSVPGAVLVRDRPDGAGVESLSATLWSSLDPAGPEFRLTYRVEDRPEQIVLPPEGIFEAITALRAHQQLQAIKIGEHRYDGVRPIHLETLIVDLRGATPAYYFLFRKDRGERGAGELQLVEAAQVRAVPPPLPSPKPSAQPVAAHSIDIEEAVQDFLRWNRSARRPPAGMERDLFSWYLAQSGFFFSLELDYPEALVAMERLCSLHGIDLCDPPLGIPRLSEADFRTLRAVQAAYAQAPDAALFTAYPVVAQTWRFRGGAPSTRPQVFRLDQPASSPYPLMEILAQSPTGRGLLREILPAMRDGTLEVRLDSSLNVPVTLATEGGKKVLRLSSVLPLGSLIAPLVRTMHLGLLRPAAAPYVLSELRMAYTVVRRVLMDLLRLNPALAPYAGDTDIPSDTELITQWSLRFDDVAKQWASRDSHYCERAIELLGAAAVPIESPPRRGRVTSE